jgi:hypothetical protein
MSKNYDLKSMKRIPGYRSYYAYKDGRIYKKVNTNYKQLCEYRRPYSKYLGVYLLNSKNDKFGFYVHKLVASAFYKINIIKYNVLHKDENSFNNVPDNLAFRKRPIEKILCNKEKAYFEKKNLIDYETMLRKYVKYDTKHYLWKKYKKLKSGKKYRLCINWLKVILSQENLNE